MDRSHTEIVELNDKINNAPQEPGCYLFKDTKGNIIYVGKAKVIRSRVKQYFMKTNQQDDKGLLLGKLIADVEFRLTLTERDALIEEYRLIKHYRPWFNSQHKTDRRNVYYLRWNRTGIYPWLEIVDRREEELKEYLGRFASEGRAKEALLVLNRVFKTPVCSRRFEKTDEEPCLHYRVHQCLGLCGGKVDPDTYKTVIKAIEDFFGGRDKKTLRKLEREMALCIREMEFERAQAINRSIEDLKQLEGRFHRRIIFPEDKEAVLFLRAYREKGCSLFYIRSGGVTGRYDICGPDLSDHLADFLKDQIGKETEVPDEQLRECLEHIYADKAVVILPLKKDLKTKLSLIRAKFTEWYNLNE